MWGSDRAPVQQLPRVRLPLSRTACQPAAVCQQAALPAAVAFNNRPSQAPHPFPNAANRSTRLPRRFRGAPGHPGLNRCVYSAVTTIACSPVPNAGWKRCRSLRKDRLTAPASAHRRQDDVRPEPEGQGADGKSFHAPPRPIGAPHRLLHRCAHRAARCAPPCPPAPRNTLPNINPLPQKSLGLGPAGGSIPAGRAGDATAAAAGARARVAVAAESSSACDGVAVGSYKKTPEVKKLIGATPDHSNVQYCTAFDYRSMPAPALRMWQCDYGTCMRRPRLHSLAHPACIGVPPYTP